MKSLRVVSLSLLVLFYGIPLSTAAQSNSETFNLPNGIAGEAYRANIQSVLRDTYHLRLETDARSSIFRWALVGGEIPPGLILRANGIIVGAPRTSRIEPYQLQLKVLDLSLPRGEALTLNFSISISAPRVRLAHISAPRLVLVEAPNAIAPKPEMRSNQPIGDAEAVDTSRRRIEVDAINDSPSAASLYSGQTSAARIYASMLRRNVDAEARAMANARVAGSCDPAHAPLPSPGGTIFTIDARDGTTSGETQFERKGKVSVVIDNKNPYLYTYKFTSEKKVIEETAPATFFPFFGGILSDFGEGTAGKDAAKTQANATKSKNIAEQIALLGPYRFLSLDGVRKNAQNCGAYATSYLELRNDIKAALSLSQDISDDLNKLAKDNKDRSDKYDDFLKVLHNAQSSSGELYCNSKELLEVFVKGALPAEIDNTKQMIEKLKTEAESFKIRIDALQENYPDCADMVILNLVRHAAEGLISDAAKYDKALKKISADLKTMNDLKDLVESNVRDPRKFRTVVEYGNYSRTTEFSLGLNRTAIEPVDGKEAKAEELVKPDDTKLKFGHAPFFSISGGVAFSPLQKLEFDRVQGFERDQQGNVVLVNGKPNLTTVVGLKEGSRSRITPMVLLNGRIHDKWGPIDGIHLSLGITAKNDNKGTDVEYLVGPSFSFLEDNMFLTLGGYAGRQQKLGGGLFQGFAVPSTVSELPIEKNYRWNFGFALSYRIPVNKK